MPWACIVEGHASMTGGRKEKNNMLFSSMSAVAKFFFRMATGPDGQPRQALSLIKFGFRCCCEY
jgi:hypothetical protein